MKPFLRCWRLDCDYDHIEHIANSDGLVREIMGLPAFGTRPGFHHRTIRDNICLVDEALLTEINALVVQLGLPILKKNAAENRAQVAGNRRCRPPGQAPAPAKPNLRPP